MALILPNPHPKQAEFLADTHRYKVLNWGRRCLGPETLITTSLGVDIPIKHVMPGMWVMSYNHELGKAEPKEVLESFRFGVDKDPKPMIELTVNGKQTTSTFDHQYFVDGHWIPAYQLAWGTLATSEREKLQLLCKQYGQTIIDPLQRGLSNTLDNSSIRRFWVLTYRPGWEDYQGTPSSSRDLAQEPAEQTTGEPHQQLTNRQQDRKPRVGNASREPSAHDDSGQAVSERRGEVRYACLEGEGCQGDTCISCDASPIIASEYLEDSSTDLSSSKTRFNPGRLEGQDLEVSSARVLEPSDCYDLEVAGNHNFVANGFLVHNTGKSVAVWEKVVLEGMLRQGTYYIIAPTYKQAKSIYWRDICKTYKGDFMTFNEQELSVTFDHLSGMEIETTSGKLLINHDPELPPTRIELKGADNPDSLRGTGICGAVMDEYAFMSDGKYLYDTIVRPALADRNGWAVFISTPNGIQNHFYDLIQNAKLDPERYFFSHATALDNPYFTNTEFEEARAEYEKEGKLDQFNQEWMAEFVNPTQLVYADFDYDTHVFTDQNMIPREGTLNLSIDFGMTDPTAAIFIRIDYAGNWWIFDEFYKPDTKPDQLVEILRDKMGYDMYTRIIGDSRGKFEMEFLRSRRFRISPSKKGADSIYAGIKEVRALLAVREGTGKPKLFVHASCKNTIKEFQRYSFERTSDGTILNTPEDDFNHAMDAIRYMALDKAKPIKKEKRKRDYDPDTGRALN